MTSPEKIEKLLNRFGQTISDLPKQPKIGFVYSEENLSDANNIVSVWSFGEGFHDCSSLVLLDFICHQSDVIERLVAALETAEKIVSCEYCVKHESKCGNCSGYECTGFQMMEVEQIKKDMEAKL